MLLANPNTRDPTRASFPALPAMPLPDPSLWFYRQMTSRSRRQLFHQLRQCQQFPVAILFYHRVARQQFNSWTISVDNFKRHLDWLEENCQLVSLAEAQRRIRLPSNDRLAVAITFDDGYGENAQFAIPELVARRIPASYFVATDFITSGRAFPHDLAAGQPLPPNTLAQLQQFAAQGIDLGAHTRTHVDIGTVVEPQRLQDEIVGSIDWLRSQLGVACRYFAFPFGLPRNMTQAAVNLLRSHSIDGSAAVADAQLARQRRLSPAARHGDPGIERLKNWLTLDRRKLQDRSSLPFDEPPHQLPEPVAARR